MNWYVDMTYKHIVTFLWQISPSLSKVLDQNIFCLSISFYLVPYSMYIPNDLTVVFSLSFFFFRFCYDMPHVGSRVRIGHCNSCLFLHFTYFQYQYAVKDNQKFTFITWFTFMSTYVSNNYYSASDLCCRCISSTKYNAMYGDTM